ncbi:MAG TPA: phospholipase D family protein [Jatrophihabitans sp.]|jgi:hypothetical protein|uniref:phospholipase D family protein n=1 Tax=Jatrophihabitans sp. TaxID=1932789 RepID=UPI002F1A7A69
MLRPENHALLTTALRPPVGYTLDRAVGTTFSLDLIAVALAQLTFAAHDLGADIDNVAPIALLDALRRHADTTTIFVQGGGIAVPNKYRPLMTILEDSIVEVMPKDGVFHPKVWALRFASPAGHRCHRVLVLSRNLTFDRTWDTMLRLDEANPEPGHEYLDGQMFAEFLRELPALANGAVPDIGDLAASLAGAQLELPKPYNTADVWALGFGRVLDPDWAATRALIVSPFLGQSVVQDIAGRVGELRVLSTPQAIDLIGTHPRNASYFTLNPAVDSGEDAWSSHDPGGEVKPVQPASETSPPLSGLHAKVVIVEHGSHAWTFTGSANATLAGFSRNVELMVELVGPRASTGIDSIWKSRPGDSGLESLVMPYEPRPPESNAKLRADLEWELFAFHCHLAGLDITTTIEDCSEDEFALVVCVPGSWDPGVQSIARPLSRPDGKNFAARMRWQPLGIAALTPFLVVESAVTRSGITMTRSCVLTTRLIGDIPKRRDQVLRDVLKSKTDVLAYLAFLLGNPAIEGGDDVTGLTDNLSGAGTDQLAAQPPVVLFEPLIRAALGDASAMERVDSLVRELTRLGDLDKLPDGFSDLWAVAQEAHGSRR